MEDARNMQSPIAPAQGMNAESRPLVSVLTPVYNGADYLSECIESVLAQTYRHFEYIIVNNCSTDRTLDIARYYAERDGRVRVHDNDRFVPVIENHNLAFGLISPASKYCKVVSADDFIFPDCIERLVALAESRESVSIVGSYQQSGSVVRWQGFDYPRSVFSGREICRRIFLDGEPSFGFGSPTSLLYRASVVRSSDAFYPNPSPHSDTSACFEHLREADFGFVYQVLSYERTHGETQSSRSAELNRYSSACLNDLIQYGRFYLTDGELRRLLKMQLNGYYEFLGINLVRFRGREFWDYHRGRLNELGHPVKPRHLLKGLVMKTTRELVNPGHALKKARAHLAGPRSSAA